MNYIKTPQMLWLLLGFIIISNNPIIAQVPALPEVHPDSIKRFTLTVSVPLSKAWLQEMNNTACEVNLSLNQRVLLMDAPGRVLKSCMSGEYLASLPGSEEIINQDSISPTIRKLLCTEKENPNCKYDGMLSHVYRLSFHLEQHGSMLLNKVGDFELIASYKEYRKDEDSIRVDKHILTASLQEIILKDLDYRKAIQLHEYDWIPAFITSDDGRIKRTFCCDAYSEEMKTRMKQKNGKGFEDFVIGLSKTCDE
jgi:hypothetical protein